MKFERNKEYTKLEFVVAMIAVIALAITIPFGLFVLIKVVFIEGILK